MVGVPWFSTTAEQEEFAEKPKKGSFSLFAEFISR
jgi:hypothetical protein